MPCFKIAFNAVGKSFWEMFILGYRLLKEEQGFYSCGPIHRQAVDTERAKGSRVSSGHRKKARFLGNRYTHRKWEHLRG